MLSCPFPFFFVFLLVTYFLPWTHSSAIVFPDGHDLGVASDSGGGGGGVDMDLDMDLLASSLEIMDDDNNDNTMFAMTNLDVGIPASALDEALGDQLFSSISEVVIPYQVSLSSALSPAILPQDSNDIFSASEMPNLFTALEQADADREDEELISSISSPAPAPAPEPPPIANEENQYPALLPNSDFNIDQSCRGKDIPGFQRACDIVRCIYNNPYNPLTNNHEPKSDLLCCPPDPLTPTHNQHRSPFNSLYCTPYAPNLPECQHSKDLQCCFTLFEPFVCDHSFVHLPSRWKEPSGNGALDGFFRVLKTPLSVPCERWLTTLGVFECEVESESYYDLRCCELQNYGTF